MEDQTSPFDSLSTRRVWWGISFWVLLVSYADYASWELGTLSDPGFIIFNCLRRFLICFRNSLPAHWQITFLVMGWLTKILKGSSYKGHSHRKYGHDRTWDKPRDSVEEDVEFAKALSLSELDQKGKSVIEDESESEDDEQFAKVESDSDEQPTRFQSDDDEKPAKVQSDDDEKPAKFQYEEDEQSAKVQLEEDEQLARALQESLNMNSPPRYDNGSIIQPFPFFMPAGYSRICAGCKLEIGHGRYLSCLGAVWHPECFRCRACNLPITDYEYSMSGNHPYHKSCYKEQHHPRCDVCKNFIPTNSAGLIEYGHILSGYKSTAPLMNVIGLLGVVAVKEWRFKHESEAASSNALVERQALNEAMEGEKNGHHHMPETRGLCLSEEQTVTTILRRPKIGAGYRMIDMVTEPHRLIRRCEVTAILVLYGLPRLLTGSILAHEMMHAWLRLNGYPNLSPEVEEGICQVLAHMWLDAEMYSTSSGDVASSSTSSPPHPLLVRRHLRRVNGLTLRRSLVFFNTKLSRIHQQRMEKVQDWKQSSAQV
ncbi:protein DA1-related 1 isoform X1 [Prunus yedoensis var. nudiflora]|uniref:Protein DA1-related 1 isoform X1 n=1 Tax=Prunus yedoensis var. nudiflora TaxID=2094558 RepID=A0A314XLC2_PRUYE|nr:protein DA1-related 1 isoform X1 [Prunus yedoensis var. nudiflora]